MDGYNWISLLGVLVFLFMGWGLSEDRRNINWRVVFWGLVIQMIFIGFVFVFPAGSRFFLWLNDIVVKVLDTAQAGSRFLFGRLALPPGATGENGESSLGFILAFQAFPTIVFFSSLVSLLYFYRILPVLIRQFARIFTRLMKISGAEALCASCNFFVGVESVLMVKPYLNRMTRSELATILTACMATVASNVLGLYVFCLKDQFPNIAGHLISASFISVPAAVVFAKLLIPESGEPQTLGKSVTLEASPDTTVFEAVINGANAGLKLIFGISALLLAVLGLVSLLDLLLTGMGGVINETLSIDFDWSLKGLCGMLFYPFTLLLGVPPDDAGVVSKIIGERLIITEVGAYQDLADAMAKELLHHPRSAVIASYVLCGFAHVASLSIFIGAITALVPEKTREIGKIGLRCLLAATLATMMTGGIAGVFLTSGSLLFG